MSPETRELMRQLAERHQCSGGDVVEKALRALAWDEPRRLSAEEMARATEEARELRARLDVRLAGMESLPANVRLR